MMIVAIGMAFDIELGCAPATGYMWQLQSLPAGVHLVGSDFSNAKDAAVGDPGVQVFHLKTERAGRFDVHFELKRRWEPQAVEQRTVEIESR
jgi:predicted secreted protein